MWICSSLSHRRAGNLIYLTPCLCVAFLQLFAARAPWSLTPALPSLVSPWVPNAVATTRGPQNQVIFRDERYSPLHTHPSFSHPLALLPGAFLVPSPALTSLGLSLLGRCRVFTIAWLIRHQHLLAVAAPSPQALPRSYLQDLCGCSACFSTSPACLTPTGPSGLSLTDFRKYG